MMALRLHYGSGMQTNLFPVTSVDYSMLVGCAFNHDGSEGTIIAYDTETYAEPMFIVRFDNGRTGTLRPTEIGSR